MKKILFAIVALAFVTSLCFAENNQVPGDNTAEAAVETKVFSGIVELVSFGGGNKGAKPAIVVVDEKGRKMDFVAAKDAKITSKEGKEIMMTDIKKGDKVTVSYIVKPDGINRAKAIKVE